LNTSQTNWRKRSTQISVVGVNLEVSYGANNDQFLATGQLPADSEYEVFPHPASDYNRIVLGKHFF
jgi:hypothetical protein